MSKKKGIDLGNSRLIALTPEEQAKMEDSDDCMLYVEGLTAAVDNFLECDVHNPQARARNESSCSEAAANKAYEQPQLARLRSQLLLLAAQQKSELNAVLDKHQASFIEKVGRLVAELNDSTVGHQVSSQDGMKEDHLLHPDMWNGASSFSSSLNPRSAKRTNTATRTSDRPNLRSRLTAIIEKRDVGVLRKCCMILHDSFFFWRDAEFRRLGLHGNIVLVTEDSWFDAVIGVVIVLNSIAMMLHLEWRGARLAVSLGISNDEGWDNAEDIFFVVEHIFGLIFLVELCLRIFALRWQYFRDWFNCFDVLLVATSSVDLYLLQPINMGSVFGQLTMVRLMRLARLFRTFRMVRTLKLFGGLRVLVKAVTSSLIALLWAMVLLGILIMIAGMLMVNLVEEYIADTANDYGIRNWTWTYYGTSVRAMYTMFEVTLSGCWPNYVRPLVHDINWAYGIFFVIYIAVVVFAVIRVITAIFLKETLDAANNDAEMMVNEKARKRAQYLEKLKAVFIMADVSGDGKVSEEEFNSILCKPIVRTLLNALELEFHEGTALFHLLDDGDGEITYEEFIQGVSRLKGQARSVDLIALQLDAQRILNYIHYLSLQLGFPELGPKHYHRLHSGRHSSVGKHRSTRSSAVTIASPSSPAVGGSATPPHPWTGPAQVVGPGDTSGTKGSGKSLVEVKL